MGVWRSGVWVWELKWRRSLFVWEEEALTQLLALIGGTAISHMEDSWVCDIGVEEGYTVKDGYAFLCKNFLPDTNLNQEECRVLKHIWKSLAPLKVKIFSWQLMLHRLPTRSNLLRRGVLESATQARCVWCSAEAESEAHLFTMCDVAVDVWLKIHSWLRISTAVPGNISLSFQSFAAQFKSKKRVEGLNLLWQSVMWSLWIASNSLIFQGERLKTCEIVDAIKHRSLQWFNASRSGG
ncbi:pantothenate synthetase, partial [Trifolium pratense]